MTLRIATRASDLALVQSRGIARRIEESLGVSVELLPMKTTGDRLKGSLALAGGKGLFIKELEEALLAGTADLAVHSAKDLPAELHPELCLAAFPERRDPRDALVGRIRGATLATLPQGARVGTGSVRRGALLRRHRADLEVVPLRGNVPTRLRKLDDEGLDAVVLASAGLERLGFGERIDERIAPDVLLPAVTQGVLALEARRGSSVARELATLDDPATAAAAAAERGFLAGVGGDCSVPLAAFAEPAGDGLRVRGLLISPDGGQVAEAEIHCEAERHAAEAAGRRLAATVLAEGGAAILAALPPAEDR